MMAHDEANPQSPSTAVDTPAAFDVLDDGMLSTEEVAELLGVDASTLRRWRTTEPPAGPPFVSISERVTKYCRKDVRDWITLRRVPTANPSRTRVGL